MKSQATCGTHCTVFQAKAQLGSFEDCCCSFRPTTSLFISNVDSHILVEQHVVWIGFSPRKENTFFDHPQKQITLVRSSPIKVFTSQSSYLALRSLLI